MRPQPSRPNLIIKASFSHHLVRTRRTFETANGGPGGRHLQLSYINKSDCKSRRFGLSGTLGTDRRPESRNSSRSSERIPATFLKRNSCVGDSAQTVGPPPSRVT